MAENRHNRTETIIMPPENNPDMTPQQLLALLRFQLEAGADEAIDDEPPVSAPTHALADAADAPVPAPMNEPVQTVQAGAAITPSPHPQHTGNWVDAATDLAALEQACADFDGHRSGGRRRPWLRRTWMADGSSRRALGRGESEGLGTPSEFQPFR